MTVAGESRKVVIPFRIENAQPKHGLRVRLSDLHWLDGFASREMAIDELVKTFPKKKQRPLLKGRRIGRFKSVNHLWSLTPLPAANAAGKKERRSGGGPRTSASAPKPNPTAMPMRRKSPAGPGVKSRALDGRCRERRCWPHL